MSSYDLLIADDEYWTREKFRTVLKWEEYDIRFLPPAENGEEVLERLEKEHCDILITDINMPFMNGIELIKRVHSLYPDIVIYVVSGYDDFQYVKESLTTGATDYLLKPINKIELVSAVSQGLELVAKKRQDREHSLRMASMINDRELSLMVEREPAVYTPSMAYDGLQDASGYSLVLIKVHDLAGYAAQKQYDMNALSYAIKTRLRKIARKEELLVFNYIYRANEFIMLMSEEPEDILKTAGAVMKGLSEEMGSPVTIAVSTRNYNVDTLREAYIEAVSALMTRKYTKQSELVSFHEKENQEREEVIHKIDTDTENSFRNLFRLGNGKAIRQIIRNDIGLQEPAVSGWKYFEVKQIVKRLCSLIIECAAKEGELKDAEELETEAELIDKHVDKLDIAVVCDLLDVFLDSAMLPPEREGTGSIKDIVHKAAAYIDAHYYEEISLRSLSEQFCVESSYFSRVFKQETGSNLMQYIAKLRMEKAMKYMLDENVNLAEIAFLVGYDDYTYFNRVFKKWNGSSPSEYRQKMLSKKCN
ncbi:MAG: response regulator [Lachnospiraceae bacterium]|nr:response regulator [Lachnospiraceae bacterium]